MSDALEAGRQLYNRRKWSDAFDALSHADEQTPLDAADLELLATAAYLIGRVADYRRSLERAHDLHRERDDRAGAARVAFWLSLDLLMGGEAGLASGWAARGQRLVDAGEYVERGYLLIPAAEQSLGAGDIPAATDLARRAAAIGEGFADEDLVTAARHLEARARIMSGDARGGLRLLDEAMVPVVQGRLSTIMTGLIYCSVIDACIGIYAVDRARQWTAAMALWCEEQGPMVTFTATCRARRAEIMRLWGQWPDAFFEASQACNAAPGAAAAGSGWYEQGEVHRLRGDFEAAEHAYHEASRHGFDPQPGLALLRNEQGRRDVARAGVVRALSGEVNRFARVRLLPALVEITLAANLIDEAEAAQRELELLAADSDSAAIRALAAHCRGALELARGDFPRALVSLRRAVDMWRGLTAAYETARVRVLLASACAALGDLDGADLELASARSDFERLGALPDVRKVDAAIRRRTGRSPLTRREEQVLRLIAQGKTNSSVAAALSLSTRTVDRHVSNIFNKLNVSSRAAATAYAYKHDIL